MILSGTKVFWTRPGKLCDLSAWLRTMNLARNACDVARNPSYHAMGPTTQSTQMGDMEDLLSLTGHNHKKIRKLLKLHLDQRMNSWLKQHTDSGCAVTDLIRSRSGLRFIGNYFPSYGLSRTAGSALSQFLSAHMPTRCYLERFNLPTSSITCSHDFWEEHFSTPQMIRDHLLLECNDSHMIKIRSSCLPYPGALNWSIALGDLDSLAKFATQTLSEAWLNHRFLNNHRSYPALSISYSSQVNGHECKSPFCQSWQAEPSLTTCIRSVAG